MLFIEENFSYVRRYGAGPMREEPISGRILLKRDYGFFEGLGRDFRTSSIMMLLAAVVVMGGGITAIISDLSVALPLQDERVRLGIELLIIGLAAAFFMIVTVVVVEVRPSMVITDTGILYAGVFQRWAEIRCCVMSKTRRGLVVWTRSRRNLRMYFRSRDAEMVEMLFHNFCSAEAFVPGNCRGSQ
jgi:uncharacterized membrane protein YobD (UPF0266 family)